MTAGRVVQVRALAALFAAVLGLGLLQAVLVPERAAGSARAAYAGPVAELHIDSQAYEGPRGTIFAGLRGRCARGYEFAELTLDFSQGDVTTPTLLGQPFPCDGRWHRQRVTSLEAFEPGPAMLTARLTVVRVSTGDPAPQAVVTKRIYVRPAAKIVLPPTAKLRPGGAVTMTVRARCDAPWVLQEFRVAASQGAFPAVAFGSTLLDLTCDGVERWVPVRIEPEDRPFRRGALLVDGEITLLDPEFFDPVAQARANRTVRVH